MRFEDDIIGWFPCVTLQAYSSSNMRATALLRCNNMLQPLLVNPAREKQHQKKSKLKIKSPSSESIDFE